MFRHQLLGLLRDGRPCHGYALVKEYMRRTGVETNSGYAYRDLQKLVGEGLVETVAKIRGADRRRRPYRITEAGRTSFDQWFSEIPEVSLAGDGELAARAIFFHEVDRESVLELLDGLRCDLWAVTKQIERQMELPASDAAPDAACAAILRRRKRMAAAELAFLEDLEAFFALREDAPTEPTKREGGPGSQPLGLSRAAVAGGR